MDYFKKVKLPVTPPLKDKRVFTEVSFGYEVYDAKDVLTDEILETFKDLELEPTIVVIFSDNDESKGEKDRLIHTDIFKTKSGWKIMKFGINWELGDSTTLFSWWDMKTLQEVYPDDTKLFPFKFYKLSGIHYVNRRQLGIPEEAEKLAETYIEGPTLVRTDIPHMTVYSGSGIRRGMSIRFNETNISSWDDVVEKLKNKGVLEN
jgi:hypothetical protein